MTLLKLDKNQQKERENVNTTDLALARRLSRHCRLLFKVIEKVTEIVSVGTGLQNGPLEMEVNCCRFELASQSQRRYLTCIFPQYHTVYFLSSPSSTRPEVIIT